MPGPVDHAAVERLALAVLERAALPGEAVVGEREAVAFTVRERDGAVLLVGPRSDGGRQYFCLRARRRAGAWAIQDTDSDRWPAPDHGWPDAPALAGSVSETDGDATVVIAPGIASPGLDIVTAELGGTRDAFTVFAPSGAFVVVLRVDTAATPSDAALRLDASSSP